MKDWFILINLWSVLPDFITEGGDCVTPPMILLLFFSIQSFYNLAVNN